MNLNLTEEVEKDRIREENNLFDEFHIKRKIQGKEKNHRRILSNQQNREKVQIKILGQK